MSANQTAKPANMTGTTLVTTKRGHMLGFYVASTTSGTIVLYDTAAADTSNAMSGTITPAVGWHAFPAEFNNGLRVVIANTINVTVFYGSG